MSKINVLNSTVYNKISAGEVVEGPVSVVKELVENSLDSGADRIFVDVASDITCITVDDNGSGIEKDDFGKVFLPHATSKIKDADDLERILSLGFRGEAMASIAAVSMVTLTSCVKGGTAYTFEISGGVGGEVLPAARDQGTTVIVRNLFFNTPARLKFMRKAKSELNLITSLMQKFALANPSIVFEYCIDGQRELLTDGDGLLSAMSAVYGDDLIDKTLEINVEEYGIRMVGFISSTSFPKPTRSFQTFIVNGRIVSNLALTTALNNVYNDYFVKRYYPFAVLCFTIDPKEIDVNVHPAKTEIKFEYQSKIFGFVQRNLRKKLEESLKQETFKFGASNGIIDDEWKTPFVPDKPIVRESNVSAPIDFIKSIESSITDESFDGSHNDGLRTVVEAKKRSFDATTDNEERLPMEEDAKPINDFHIIDNRKVDFFANIDEDTPEFSQQSLKLETKEGVDFKVAGQLFGTYIILEYGDNLLVVDQHAAAEYTLYSKLKAQMETDGVLIQPLLLPYEFEVSPEDVEILTDKLELMNKVGIGVERIEGSQFKITSLPVLLVGLDFDYLISEFLSDKDASMPIKERLMYTACRAAIKGNTYLDENSIKVFFIDTFKNGIYPKCPHGRPAFIIVTKKELEKLFMRVC